MDTTHVAQTSVATQRARCSVKRLVPTRSSNILSPQAQPLDTYSHAGSCFRMNAMGGLVTVGRKAKVGPEPVRVDGEMRDEKG